MTIQSKPERKRRAVNPLDDQKTREDTLLAILICFENDVALFSHEVRIGVLHRCWGNLVAHLAKRRITADWQEPHPNTGRWKRLDETIQSLIEGGSLRLGLPIGRGSILLNLEDEGKEVFKSTSKEIFKAVEDNFESFKREYFLS